MRKTIFSILAFIAKNCPSYDTLRVKHITVECSVTVLMLMADSYNTVTYRQ